ncbi:transmembrane protein 60-like [Paramormyrops kingsleyae]|uniref:Transmembrane protein 60 n=1 Tax=Paramormyrops kingsleyae TaxID=1676925 RepID=A0A3B3S6W1_9TELE|nr:transmembrane protein 60-like [Paramormyrops kingsleyae]
MSMSLAQRVLLTWIFSLVFLIMLVLKLDEKVNWNWFLIFVPIWIFDAILLLMLALKMAGHCKPGHEPRDGPQDLRRKTWYLTAMLLKVAFCLTLCVRLEQLAEIKLSLVCIPLWVLLLGAMTELGYNIFPEQRD